VGFCCLIDFSANDVYKFNYFQVEFSVFQFLKPKEMAKRKMSAKVEAELNHLFTYLCDFYGKEGTYPDTLPNLTKEEVGNAIKFLKSKRAYIIPWSGGDSTDRERARDFILLSRKKNPLGKHLRCRFQPRRKTNVLRLGYILSSDKFEYGLQDILLNFRWRIVSPEQYLELEKQEKVIKKLKKEAEEWKTNFVCALQDWKDGNEDSLRLMNKDFGYLLQNESDEGSSPTQSPIRDNNNNNVQRNYIEMPEIA